MAIPAIVAGLSIQTFAAALPCCMAVAVAAAPLFVPTTMPASTANRVLLVVLTASKLIRRRRRAASSWGIGAMGLAAKWMHCDFCNASMADEKTLDVWRLSS